MECKELVTTKQGVLTTRARDWNESEFESQANCLARLKVLSCSATAGVTLQLPLHASHVCHFGDLSVARSSREALLNCILISFSSYSLTHYPYMIPT